MQRWRGFERLSLVFVVVKAKNKWNIHFLFLNENPSNKICVDELEQLRLYAHFLSMSSIVSDPKRIPSNLLQIPSSIKALPLQPSNLQKRVVSALNEAFSTISDGWKYSVSTELSSFDGVFPVDAMIQKNGRILAMIEVDGPQHTRWDGRMLRKDLLKEFMYLRKHPGSVFHRIRWDEENKVGADVLARELASFIEESSKKFDNVFLNVLYNVEKSVKEFFSWGLRNSKDY
jgi:hypothetical protein